MVPEHDPIQALWLHQPAADTGAMPLDEIRDRAKLFEARIARRNRIEYVAVACGIAIYSAFTLLLDDPLVRAGSVLTILGALLMMVLLHRRGRAASRAELAGVADKWVVFHLAALTRQRDALRHVWSWYLGPLAPGLVLFSIGIGAASIPAPFGIVATIATLLIIGAAFQFVASINRKAAAQLQARIDELEALRLAP